jgi:hypothetical protein
MILCVRVAPLRAVVSLNTDPPGLFVRSNSLIDRTTARTIPSSVRQNSFQLESACQFTVLMLPLTISLISHSINHLRDDSQTASGSRS